MKIALLSYEYPPETGFGGIGTYSWYQARALARLGHEVHVLAGSVDPQPLSSTVRDGVHVHRCRSSRGVMDLVTELDGPRLWWTKWRLHNALSMLEGFRALHEEHGFDVVEMPECGAEGALINRLLDVPTMIKFHSPARLIMPTYEVEPADIELCALVERLAIEGADAFVSCTRWSADEIHEKMKLDREIGVVANGIDLDLFDAHPEIDVRVKHGIPEDRPIIFFCGRMEPRKGIHLCEEIAGSILSRHEAAFVFAGEDLFGTMEKEILPALDRRALKGSVHFVGRVPLAEAQALTRRSEIFFMPSAWENCPYACMEAMSAGRAVIGARNSGFPELIIEGESGLLADFGSAEPFIEAMEKLLSDPELRRGLGAGARRRIEDHYTDLHIARQTCVHYENAIAAHGTPRGGDGRRLWGGELDSALSHSLELLLDAEPTRRERERLRGEAHALRWSPEFRLGHRLRSKPRLHRLVVGLMDAPGRFLALRNRARLALERRVSARKPRVLVLATPEFPVYSQTFVYEELTRLRAAGFAVRLIYFEDQEPRTLAPRHRWLLGASRRLDRSPALCAEAFELERRSDPDGVRRIVDRIAEDSGRTPEEVESHDDFLAAFSVLGLARAWQPDYIHSYFFYGESLMARVCAERLGVPRGMTAYADHMLDDHEFKLVGPHVRDCDVVVATSRRIEGELIGAAGDVPVNPILVKPNAVDCSAYPVVPRHEPADGQPFRIACVARFDPKKGLIEAVEALRLLLADGLHVDLHLIGDSDPASASSVEYRCRLVEHIELHDLWGRVHLEGVQSEEGVKRFLSLCQLFVAPFRETAAGDKDGVPTALLEAMSTGAAIVATNSGSISEVLTDGIDGIVVPRDDPDALARAMAELLADPERRRRLGVAAAERARSTFDVSVCEPAFHDRVRAAVARSSGRHQSSRSL